MVDPSYWKLTVCDIANGNGICTATLKTSGTQFKGKIDKSLSLRDCLRLNTDHGGYVDIDYDEIAAIGGELP